MIHELNTPIQIVEPHYGKDQDGFQTVSDTILACVRAKVEYKNLTEKWKNSALLQEATCIFLFRTIPGITVTSDMEIICHTGRYNILSLLPVHGKGMYLQAVARLEDKDGNHEADLA